MRRVSSAGPFSQEGLDRLLATLDPDRDRAGLKYETLRRKLLRFFEWRSCHPAEELADETLDRVARKLAEDVEIRVADPASYVYGFARNIAREALARGARRPQAVSLAGEAQDLPDPAGPEPPAEDLEGALRCLDQCLEALPIEMRQLVLLHHSDRRHGSQKGRLLEALGIPAQALWVRMHRMRKRLERCVRDCMESGPAGRGKGVASSRHSFTRGADEP